MDGFTFYLSGDLSQMGEQRMQLRRQGFEMIQNDVHPVLKTEDKKRALTFIYEYRIAGWWNYKDVLIELGICTKEEYIESLRIQ